MSFELGVLGYEFLGEFVKFACFFRRQINRTTFYEKKRIVRFLFVKPSKKSVKHVAKSSETRLKRGEYHNDQNN